MRYVSKEDIRKIKHFSFYCKNIPMHLSISTLDTHGLYENSYIPHVLTTCKKDSSHLDISLIGPFAISMKVYLQINSGALFELSNKR